MSHRIEHRVMTLRSATKNNFVTKNSNTPELRRSKRIANKRSYDRESSTDKRNHAKHRRNDTKRTKYQLPTVCNKSTLIKVIIILCIIVF